MNRKYHVSRLTDAAAAVHILEEMEQLDGLRSAHITEDLSVMDVDVDDERLEADVYKRQHPGLPHICG